MYAVALGNMATFMTIDLIDKKALNYSKRAAAEFYVI